MTNPGAQVLTLPRLSRPTARVGLIVALLVSTLAGSPLAPLHAAFCPQAFSEEEAAQEGVRTELMVSVDTNHASRSGPRVSCHGSPRTPPAAALSPAGPGCHAGQRGGLDGRLPGAIPLRC